ncbi:MAG: hypothetical protein IKA79_04890, partial [Lentisphaeria bacterium]|nr:hypothetical protein [Lentisphaeria bacterium]
MIKTPSGKVGTYFRSAVFSIVCCAAFSGAAQDAGSGSFAPEQMKLEPFEFEIPAEATMNEVKGRRNILETNVF